MVQTLCQVFGLNLAVDVHVTAILGWTPVLRFGGLYLLVDVWKLSDVLENDVKHTRFQEFVKLLSNLAEIANRAVEDAKALLDLAQDFWEVLNSFLVCLIVNSHAHTYVWDQGQHICVKIIFASAMSCHFLHYPKNPLLSAELEEIHLLEDAADSSALEDCWRILHGDLLVCFYTRFR